MARAAVTSESLIGHFRDVRAAHDDLYSHGAHSVRHAIGLGDHPGHRTDADQSHILFAHVSRDTLLRLSRLRSCHRSAQALIVATEVCCCNSDVQNAQHMNVQSIAR